ncbi:methyltransferase domain-containing protein, partial [Vibrio sp. Vb2424]|uniref:methyltransferase domain-containing protein n=1 Tax=Vibrio sp. Vb2424 TaxID=2816074 RepID=UPI001A8F262F
LDLLAKQFGETASVDLLDIGCGVGNYHRLLKPKVGSLTGVDVAAQCVAVASEANPGVRYDSYDGMRLPYAEGSFDAAFSI